MKRNGGIEMSKKKCKACLGYGFWAWSHIAPMGQMDAEDGVPTIVCPECKANPNPIRTSKLYRERIDEIKELHKKGLLKFGEAKNDDEFMKVWTKINKGRHI